MKRLGNVGRGEFDDDPFSLSQFIGTVVWLTRRCAVRLAVDLREDFADHVLGIHLKVEEGLVVRDGRYPIVRLKLK